MGGRSMTIPSNRTRYLVPATIWVSQNLKRSAHGNAHGGTPDYFYGSKNQVTSGLFSAEDGGFEPPRAFTQHAFQACAIGH